MQISRLLVMSMLMTLAMGGPAAGRESLEREVHAAEQSFARSMADRDFDAFAALLAEDAVFFGRETLRGKAAVLTAWRPFFTGAAAPFSWAPETVVVVASGTLAYSSGPIFDAAGQQVATFNSVWRREPDGQWRVVFDKGCDRCRCE